VKGLKDYYNYWFGKTEEADYESKWINRITTYSKSWFESKPEEEEPTLLDEADKYVLANQYHSLGGSLAEHLPQNYTILYLINKSWEITKVIFNLIMRMFRFVVNCGQATVNFFASSW